MDEGPDPVRTCRTDGGQGARYIACVEARRVRRVDHASDVQHPIGISHQPLQAVVPIKRSVNPCNPRTSRLRLASQGVTGQAQRTGLSNRSPADKSGPAGYGYAEGFVLNRHLYTRPKTHIPPPCVSGWTDFTD